MKTSTISGVCLGTLLAFALQERTTEKPPARIDLSHLTLPYGEISAQHLSGHQPAVIVFLDSHIKMDDGDGHPVMREAGIRLHQRHYANFMYLYQRGIDTLVLENFAVEQDPRDVLDSARRDYPKQGYSIPATVQEALGKSPFDFCELLYYYETPVHFLGAERFADFPRMGEITDAYYALADVSDSLASTQYTNEELKQLETAVSSHCADERWLLDGRSAIMAQNAVAHATAAGKPVVLTIGSAHEESLEKAFQDIGNDYVMVNALEKDDNASENIYDSCMEILADVRSKRKNSQ